MPAEDHMDLGTRPWFNKRMVVNAWNTCSLPSLVGRLARHQDVMQIVWILGCFSGVRVVVQPRWLLDSMTYVCFGHVALQSGWRELLSHINNHRYKSFENVSKDIGGKKEFRLLKEDLWTELSLKQCFSFPYHLIGFFLFNNGCAIVFR